MVVKTTPPEPVVQQLAQVRPALGLHRLLAQQLVAAAEGAEELVVQVVAVGDDHQRRVLHGRVQDHPPGVKGHGQALARALGVPDHADALVAGLRVARRPGQVGARPSPTRSAPQRAGRRARSPPRPR